MSTVLTSIGAKFYTGYGVSEAGEWSRIPEVIECSEFDLDPDTIDTTSFDNLKYKSSVAGLIDTSGIQYLTVNATQCEKAETIWDGLPASTWLKVEIPNKADHTFIPIAPIKTGAYNLTVNDRITIRLKFTITGDLFFGTDVEFAEYVENVVNAPLMA